MQALQKNANNTSNTYVHVKQVQVIKVRHIIQIMQVIHLRQVHLVFNFRVCFCTEDILHSFFNSALLFLVDWTDLDKFYIWICQILLIGVANKTRPAETDFFIMTQKLFNCENGQKNSEQYQNSISWDFIVRPKSCQNCGNEQFD